MRQKELIFFNFIHFNTQNFLNTPKPQIDEIFYCSKPSVDCKISIKRLLKCVMKLWIVGHKKSNFKLFNRKEADSAVRPLNFKTKLN
jgi:hypothetical protein